MGVHKGLAYFAVIDQFENAYDVSVNHFLYETTFWKSTHLILLPLKHFGVLSERCGDPKPGTVSMLFGTARYSDRIYLAAEICNLVFYKIKNYSLL